MVGGWERFDYEGGNTRDDGGRGKQLTTRQGWRKTTNNTRGGWTYVTATTGSGRTPVTTGKGENTSDGRDGGIPAIPIP